MYKNTEVVKKSLKKYFFYNGFLRLFDIKVFFFFNLKIMINKLILKH